MAKHDAMICSGCGKPETVLVMGGQRMICVPCKIGAPRPGKWQMIGPEATAAPVRPSTMLPATARESQV